jgi:hypothetical protein
MKNYVTTLAAHVGVRLVRTDGVSLDSMAAAGGAWIARAEINGTAR